MPLTITPHDVHCFRQLPGENRPEGVKLEFFQTPESLDRVRDREGNWWFVVRCKEGGTIEVPMQGRSIMYSEPERH